MPILASRLSAIVSSCLLVGALALTGSSSSRAAYESPSTRVLVKLRPSLAAPVEAALPSGTMRLEASSDPGLQGFLSTHQARALRPLYPSIVGDKKTSGRSARQLAESVRQKFKVRAARSEGPFAPPDLSRTYVLELSGIVEGAPLEARLAALRADANVERADVDRKVSVLLTPDDPYFSSAGTWGQPYDDLYGVKKIGSASAWESSRGAGVIVAVVDTGVDYNHADLASNIWTNPGEIAGNGRDDDGNGFVDDVRGWDFVGRDAGFPTPDNDPMDVGGHGTHVSGTIAATGNNHVGVIGVAFESKIMAVRGLDDLGYGADSGLANALVYATNNGAHVINNSWGGPGESWAIAEAVAYAHSHGVVVVAAAGNDNDDARSHTPAGLARVITVAATDADDVKANFSNHGPKIDVAAPGVDILSLRAAGTHLGDVVGTDYVRASGTSMAAPHVCGLAALILAQHPTYTNEQVRQVLRGSALDAGAPGQDRTFGYGRIDANAAMALVGPLEAKITAPADGVRLNAPVRIVGSAGGPGFVHYTLEYGAGEWPTAWTFLSTGSAPVREGTLGQFDTSAVPDGRYALRLTAFNGSGVAFVDRIVVEVDYIAIREPAPVPVSVPWASTTFRPGTAISITGRATGPSFLGFDVSWARGVNATSGWSAAGVQLAGGGALPIDDGRLAAWTPAGIGSAGYYTIRLRVKNQAHESTTRTTVYLEPDLLPGHWPQVLEVPPDPYLGTGAVARKADGSLRLFFELPGFLGRTEESAYRVFTPAGKREADVRLTNAGYTKPAAGDLGGDKSEEVVVAEGAALRIFRPDHTSYYARPYVATDVGFLEAIPVLEDLDGDGRLEILAVGRGFGVDSLFAWKSDGTRFSQAFPIHFEARNQALAFFFGSRVVVADLEGDGRKEILVVAGPTADSARIRRFGLDGVPQPFDHPALPAIVTGLAVADLDGDGTLEVVVSVDGYDEEERALHVFRPDGSEKPGWPARGDTRWFALGDLDGDGAVEIVTSGIRTLSVFTHDGTPFSPMWPKQDLAGSAQWPVLADVDSDGRVDIVVAHERRSVWVPAPELTAESARPPRGVRRQPTATAVRTGPTASAVGDPPNLLELLAFRASDGALLRSWNMTGAVGEEPVDGLKPFVGDFDGDGRVDIGGTYPLLHKESATWGTYERGVFTAITTGGIYKPAAAPWPMTYRDARNSNVVPATVVRRETVPPVAVLTEPADGASVQGTITVRATASDNVAVRRVELYLDGRWIASDATAPYSFVWNTRLARGGSHTLVAKAYDTSGNVDASAPVRVTTPSTRPTLTVNGSSTPITVPPGAVVTVTLSNGLGFPLDRVVKAEYAGPLEEFFDDWQYLNGQQTPPTDGHASATLTFTMPTTPGLYGFRYLWNGTIERFAFSPRVTVTEGAQ
jgi:subtilisin family serine protease